jgi:hypothetical protein
MCYLDQGIFWEANSGTLNESPSIFKSRRLLGNRGTFPWIFVALICDIPNESLASCFRDFIISDGHPYLKRKLAEFGGVQSAL